MHPRERNRAAIRHGATLPTVEVDVLGSQESVRPDGGAGVAMDLAREAVVDADVEHGAAILPANRVHAADLDAAQLDAGVAVEVAEARGLQVHVQRRGPGHHRRVEGQGDQDQRAGDRGQPDQPLGARRHASADHSSRPRSRP